MRLPMNPSQMPACTGILSSARASAKPVASVRGRHDLQQPHDVCRTKEMQADEARRIGNTFRNETQIEIGRVGGNDGVGPTEPAKLVEYGTLNAEFLEHG